MAVSARSLLTWCATAMLAAGCTQTVGGAARPEPPGIDDDSRSPVDVDELMLDTSQMQAITGADGDLTAIPGMDGRKPVDIDQLAEATPPQCQWYFAESQAFGSEIEEFRKTTFQHPPKGALISEGAAAYRDAETAHRAFDALVEQVRGCDSTPYGRMFVGEWTTTPDSLRTRTASDCGRDYRVQSVVLVEVTICGFPDSVPDIVLTNILANLPG